MVAHGVIPVDQAVDPGEAVVDERIAAGSGRPADPGKLIPALRGEPPAQASLMAGENIHRQGAGSPDARPRGAGSADADGDEQWIERNRCEGVDRQAAWLAIAGVT